MMNINPLMQGRGGGGGLSNGTVLWENPNPTAAFASQIVTLSQSYKNFKYIGMKFIFLASDTTGVKESFVSTEDLGKVTGAYSGAISICYKLTPGAGSDYWYARDGYMTDNTHMRISDLFRAGGGSNTELIPTQIVGYN